VKGRKLGKKAAVPLIIGILIVAAAAIGVYKGFVDPWLEGRSADVDEPLAIEKDGKTQIVDNPEAEVTEKELTSCSGLQEVYGKYDDFNKYNIAVDPASHLTIFEKNDAFFKQVIADDATDNGVDPLSSFKGLAGNNLGTPVAGYFGEEVEFETGCLAEPIQVDLYPAAAPSLIITNDNGKTLNSDTNHETMAGGSPYTHCVTVKAPAQNCSARYGALVAIESDGSFINKVAEASGLSTKLSGVESKFKVAKSDANLTPTMEFDQFDIFFWNEAVQDVDGDGNNDVGFLCNGKSVDVCYTVTTTSTNPGEDEANYIFHWYPVNKDLHARSLEPIMGMYDEENHVISVGNSTVVGYTA
jgi:hypothetical protein